MTVTHYSTRCHALLARRRRYTHRYVAEPEIPLIISTQQSRDTWETLATIASRLSIIGVVVSFLTAAEFTAVVVRRRP